jgi:hypothetical protein
MIEFIAFLVAVAFVVIVHILQKLEKRDQLWVLEDDEWWEDASKRM